jgi:prepilin-type N-terminal cleavage/methylation domain-containing protein
MQLSPRHGRAAFSLIELLAVIAIIVILATVVAGGMGYASERQAKEKARVQIALLCKGIDAYKADMGQCPASTLPGADTPSKCLYTQLFLEGYQYQKDSSRPDAVPPAHVEAKSIYVAELAPGNSKQGWTSGDLSKASAITDPWGHEYLYRSGADTGLHNPDFDLLSMGKDGYVDGQNPQNTQLKDDIKNF